MCARSRTFNTCMDRVLSRMADGTGCDTSVGDVMITDLDFANDAVVFAELVETLIEALEKLSEESEPLGLRVSWPRPKYQVQVSVASWTQLCSLSQ